MNYQPSVIKREPYGEAIRALHETVYPQVLLSKLSALSLVGQLPSLGVSSKSRYRLRGTCNRCGMPQDLATDPLGKTSRIGYTLHKKTQYMGSFAQVRNALDGWFSYRRAFRNSDKQSISELKWLPLLAKLSLFPPRKSPLHWISF